MNMEMSKVFYTHKVLDPSNRILPRQMLIEMYDSMTCLEMQTNIMKVFIIAKQIALQYKRPIILRII